MNGWSLQLNLITLLSMISMQVNLVMHTPCHRRLWKPCRNYVADGKNIIKYFTDVQHRKRERNRSHSKYKKRSRSSSSSSSTSTDSSSSSETSSSSSSDSSPGKKWISSISIQYIILLLFHIIIIVTHHILLNCNNNINVMCESLNIQIY